MTAVTPELAQGSPQETSRSVIDPVSGCHFRSRTTSPAWCRALLCDPGGSTISGSADGNRLKAANPHHERHVRRQPRPCGCCAGPLRQGRCSRRSADGLLSGPGPPIHRFGKRTSQSEVVSLRHRDWARFGGHWTLTLNRRSQVKSLIHRDLGTPDRIGNDKRPSVQEWGNS